ncbi:MAG: hypothetical protein FVQ81_14120 [Candidatus Glassbacteria bacterium]|nr:hypothetical protein [Candidatus Glassbacteria bacterium]
MSVMLMFTLALLISVMVLVGAILIFRHQRKVQEAKAAYQKCSRERGFHYRRYTTFQAELEKLRVSYNSRVRDLLLLNGEMGTVRDQIREILGILRDECKGVDKEMESDLGRIILRRKEMIENLWGELNGKKALWMEKLKKAKSDRQNQNSLIDKKDSEFKLLTQLNKQLSKLKRDYDQIASSSIVSFGKNK